MRGCSRRTCVFAPPAAVQPETRTYRLQLYDGDNPVGDYSDEVSVVTLP